MRNMPSCAIALVALAVMCIGPVSAGELHEAAKQGDSEKVTVLAQGGTDLNAHAPNGETALILAILGGHLATAKSLIDHGAQVNTRNKGGFTPLHAAAYAKQGQILRLLIDKGIDVNDRKNKAGVSPLSVAAEEGHADVVQQLIDLGADVEAGEQNGYTPLTRALWRGHQSVAGVLQKSGAKCQAVEILEEPTYSICLAGQKP